MKKCKFCEHRTRNDNNEDVCAKRLLYVGDNVKDEISCNDFSIDADILPGIIVVIVSIGLLFLMNALI